MFLAVVSSVSVPKVSSSFRTWSNRFLTLVKASPHSKW
jgi:hypothetical protein